MAPGFLFCPAPQSDNEYEAHKMRRAKENFARPYGSRDFEFVRAGPDGACWVSADGMVVRIAAAEDTRARIRKAAWTPPPERECERELERSGAT